MSSAPIALFVYNRPRHTRETVAALQKNILAADSDLIIFSDGPKDTEASRQGVAAVRAYLPTIAGFRSVRIVGRDENKGLANSIIAGVTEVVRQYGRVIVVEDDLVSSRHFLEYMNAALDFYAQEDRVISIHAYIYPVRGVLPETYFLKGADCWGWATWRRGWDLFNPDGAALLRELEARELTAEFDFSGSYPYTKMLRNQIAGRTNSWAIRWYASAFLRDKLTLYPGRALVNNIGQDGSGTHGRGLGRIPGYHDVEEANITVTRIPIQEDARARTAVTAYFRSQTNLLARGGRYLSLIRRRLFKN